MGMTIKELREQTGMSQKQFADYFKIKKRTLQDWEYGRYRPLDALVDLMEYKLRHEGLIRSSEETSAE